MIAAWMLYCTAFGLLLALACMLAEGAVGARGGQTRRIWVAGLLGLLILPAFAVVVKDAPPAYEVDGAMVPASPASGVVMESVVTLSALDGLLTTAWLLASSVLAVLLAGGLFVTWRRRGSWARGRVGEVPVLVSESVGPAVVGVMRSSIVMPEWAMTALPGERDMMLRHEQEHLVAHDTRTILVGALLVIAMPWNVAAWYMARRLRLAVEVDCDRRVVSGGDLDVRSYAELLLTVGARRSLPAYAIGFSVGRPFLEHRIDRMTVPTDRRRGGLAFLAGVGVVLALGVAWDLPQPVRAALVSQELFECPIDEIETTKWVLDAYLRST